LQKLLKTSPQNFSPQNFSHTLLQKMVINRASQRMAEKSCQVIRDEITGQIDEPVNGWAVASGFTVSPCPVTLMYGAL